MNEQVSKKILILNFLFTIGIVLYHFRWQYDFNIKYIGIIDKKIASIFVEICEKIGYLSMIFFFLVSGFLFYYNISKPKETFTKMKKRVKTLLIPYLLWFFITLMYLVINGKLKVYSITDFIELFFLNPINGPMWYCLALLLLMIPSPLVVKLKNKRVVSTVFLILLLIFLNLKSLGIIGDIFSFEKWWWYGNIIMYLQSYAIGVYLALLFSDKIVRPKNKSILSCIVGLILIIVFSYISFKIDIWQIKQTAYIVVIVGLWLFFDIKTINKIRIPHISFFLYAMHQPILIPETNRLLYYIVESMPLNGVYFVIMKLFGVCFMTLFCWGIHLL